jgi:hypothetical protein
LRDARHGRADKAGGAGDEYEIAILIHHSFSIPCMAVVGLYVGRALRVASSVSGAIQANSPRRD